MKLDARIAVALPAHPKTKKLIHRLGGAAAWGLVCLWLWARQNRSDGYLAGLSDEDLELAVDWRAADGKLVETLAAVGFLDGEEGNRSLHDWDMHQPWSVGENERSESSRWSAMVKHHGIDGAKLKMPEYYETHRERCESHAKRTGKSANAENAPAPASKTAAPYPYPYPYPYPSPTPTSILVLAPDGAEPVDAAAVDSTGASPNPALQKNKKGAASETLRWAAETGWQGFSDVLMDELAEAYPACDIRRQLLAMEQWLKANKQKARKSNWRKFVTNWLAKEQDRGGDLKGRTPFQAFMAANGAKKDFGRVNQGIAEPAWDWRAAAGRLGITEVPSWAMLERADKVRVLRSAGANDNKTSTNNNA